MARLTQNYRQGVSYGFPSLGKGLQERLPGWNVVSEHEVPGHPELVENVDPHLVERSLPAFDTPMSNPERTDLEPPDTTRGEQAAPSMAATIPDFMPSVHTRGDPQGDASPLERRVFSGDNDEGEMLRQAANAENLHRGIGDIVASLGSTNTSFGAPDISMLSQSLRSRGTDIAQNIRQRIASGRFQTQHGEQVSDREARRALLRKRFGVEAPEGLSTSGLGEVYGQSAVDERQRLAVANSEAARAQQQAQFEDTLYSREQEAEASRENARRLLATKLAAKRGGSGGGGGVYDRAAIVEEKVREAIDLGDTRPEEEIRQEQERLVPKGGKELAMVGRAVNTTATRTAGSVGKHNVEQEQANRIPGFDRVPDAPQLSAAQAGAVRDAVATRDTVMGAIRELADMADNLGPGEKLLGKVYSTPDMAHARQLREMVNTAMREIEKTGVPSSAEMANLRQRFPDLSDISHMADAGNLYREALRTYGALVDNVLKSSGYKPKGQAIPASSPAPAGHRITELP